METRAGFDVRHLRWLLLAGTILLAGVGVLDAQTVSCSGNAGGLNERRYSVTPLDIIHGSSQITAVSFDQGSIIITQQVQVVVELMQQTHFATLCLNANNQGTPGARSISPGDLEWRRISPDPMAGFAPVSFDTPAPVIAQQTQGSITAIYEFRLRLRWNIHVPGNFSSGLVWTAYRNSSL